MHWGSVANNDTSVFAVSERVSAARRPKTFEIRKTDRESDVSAASATCTDWLVLTYRHARNHAAPCGGLQTFTRPMKTVRLPFKPPAAAMPLKTGRVTAVANKTSNLTYMGWTGQGFQVKWHSCAVRLRIACQWMCWRCRRQFAIRGSDSDRR